jgi:mRNA interferase MazF
MAVFTQFHGLPSQRAVSTPEGLKHASAIQCDGLVSLEKSRLTDYVGELATDKMREFDIALAVALGLPANPRAPIEPR